MMTAQPRRPDRASLRLTPDRVSAVLAFYGKKLSVTQTDMPHGTISGRSGGSSEANIIAWRDTQSGMTNILVMVTRSVSHSTVMPRHAAAVPWDNAFKPLPRRIARVSRIGAARAVEANGRRSCDRERGL